MRQGSESVEAKGDILTQLMQMTARVPFDDRRNTTATTTVISPVLVRNFLSDIKSDLIAPESDISDIDLYRNLRLTARVNDHEAPKNIALLFFAYDPTEFFPGARIEIVQFGEGVGGDLFEEKIFRGPLHVQLRQALDYLDGLSTTIIKKIPGQAEAQRTVTFPYEAMKEALVNAVYHRGYEGIYEPIKVYLYPDRMEIISYPGPMPGLEMSHFQPGAVVPAVPNRNRRIGEFLKELKLAEARGTGILKIRRKMRENGSAEPVFEFDETRTYFRVILPAHPQYIVINALREGARSWIMEEPESAIRILEAALKRVPKSGALLAQLIEYKLIQGDFAAAEKLFKLNEKDPDIVDRHLLFKAMETATISQQNQESRRFLSEIHRFFASKYELIKDNPKEVYDYAKAKLKLSASLRAKAQSDAKTRLLKEAVELLRRVIQLSDDEAKKAWSWFHIARALARLRSPETEVVQAYSKAAELLPDEPRFTKWYEKWNSRRRKDMKP